MPEIPECLHRRYKALDNLIEELSSLPGQGSNEECSNNSHDPGIKLMCDFWNILKEDPDCNLCQAVKQRMRPERSECSAFPPQNVACFMAGRGAKGGDKKREAMNKIRDICCGSRSSQRSAVCPTSTSKENTPEMPLTKALCNLKEAASLDKRCNLRVMELMETQNELKTQIQNLEQREREGVTLLKEADCMWSCMEDEYKKKIAQSMDRQKELMKQLREVEQSNNKWRKNKKDVEDQLKSVFKCRQEMSDKTMHKKNDLKVIEMEMTDFNKRIATNKRLSDGSNQVLKNKRTISDKKIADIASEVTKLKNTLIEVQKYKRSKEEDGQKYVKEAREDLQKICKTLLQKKIENEDLLAEKDAILQEIDLLKQSCDQCKDKCQIKRDTLDENIQKVENEIKDYKYQCIQCHQCIDTADARNFCSDCPKCKEQRECITSGDHCERDTTYDCVCIDIKEKFLNNVFENMYTVMERQSKTKPGKALSGSIVKCLKNSRNGKLNTETRQQVQEFVLNTVKKNLNLTIVGGAVKTRCEMDADTYKQLLLCLKQVKAEKPPKEDKGTVAKKESCRRWGGPSECNCPGGAKYCACTTRAPPPPRDPSPCPPVLEKEEEDDVTVVLCPHKESVGCGPSCVMNAVPSSSGVASKDGKSSNACATSECPFKKNVRAAQCVLGPESLSSLPTTYMSSKSFIPEHLGISDKVHCRYGSAPPVPSMCSRDRARPRDKMIEEVMGIYSEVAPIAKVRSFYEDDEQNYKTNLGENISHECNCDLSNASKDGISQICNCSSDILLIEGTDALIDMLRRKKLTHVCKTIWNSTNATGAVKLLPKPENAAFNKNGDARVHVILHPKTCLDKLKGQDSLSSPPGCFHGYPKGFDNANDLNEGGKKKPHNGLYYKKKVDDDVQDLLKNNVASDVTDDKFGPNVKWMNVDSLIQLMPSQLDTENYKNSNVEDSENKTFKKPVKTYDRKLQTYPKPNKLQSSTVPEVLNNQQQICNYCAKKENKKKLDMTYVHDTDHKCYKSALDNESKRYSQIKKFDRQLEGWRYYKQTFCVTAYKSPQFISHEQNIKYENTVKRNDANNRNICNVNYIGMVKHKKTPEIGITNSSMTWAQTNTFHLHPEIRTVDDIRRKSKQRMKLD